MILQRASHGIELNLLHFTRHISDDCKTARQMVGAPTYLMEWGKARRGGVIAGQGMEVRGQCKGQCKTQRTAGQGEGHDGTLSRVDGRTDDGARKRTGRRGRRGMVWVKTSLTAHDRRQSGAVGVRA